MRDFRYIPLFSPREEFHEETDVAVDGAIVLAARLLGAGYTDDECISELTANGYVSGGIANARLVLAAGRLLNGG